MPTAPVLSSRLEWAFPNAESRRPATLPLRFDVVRVSLGLGVAAVDAMRNAESTAGPLVGPLLCCLAHDALLVPVVAGTTDRWRAAHSDCLGDMRLECGHREDRGAHHQRFWVAPPRLPRPTTDATALYNHLAQVRSSWPRTPPPTSSHLPCPSEEVHV